MLGGRALGKSDAGSEEALATLSEAVEARKLSSSSSARFSVAATH